MVLEWEAISLKSAFGRWKLIVRLKVYTLWWDKNQEVAEEYAKNINVRKTKAAAEFTSLFSWR